MTSFIKGKNCIWDGSGSGSATVGQLEILTLAHQPNIWYCLCSISVTKDYIRVHMHSAKSYSVIPNNEKSLCTFSDSSNFVMLLLVEKSHMFTHAALSTKSNVNPR